MFCDQPLQHPRSVALQVANRLDKYIPLPPRPKFKVNDVLQRGEVYSFIRSKSSFFAFPDHISRLKHRLVNITSTGFMIIYETNDSGLVIDLRRIINIICSADRFVQKSKKLDYLRCHIKIRMPRGNIHIFVREENIHKWTCAIMRAAARPGKIVKNLPASENVVMTAIEEMSDEIEDMTQSTATTPCESCQEAALWKEEEEDEEEEEEEMNTVIENPNPVVNPTTSVRSIRLKLEKDLKMKPKEQVEAEQQQQLKKPLFVSELFCPPTGSIFVDQTIVMEPTDEKERKEQEKEVQREEKWWLRSLRC